MSVCLKVILALYLLISGLSAQTTGKIFGVLADSIGTYDLPEITIKISNYNLIIPVDSGGFFAAVGVPSGIHTVTVRQGSEIRLQLPEVMVAPGEATRLDLALPAILPAADSIQAPLSTTDSWEAQSTSVLNAEYLNNLPVRGLNAYLELEPGVVLHNDNLHIRGGRDDETAYLLNGISTLNPLDFSNAVYVIPEAISELRVLRGGFTAGFGLASSGLILTEMKRGTGHLQVSLNMQTDKFASEGEQFFSTYSYREHIVLLQASGPVYDDRLRFYLALENNNMGDAAKRFSTGRTWLEKLPGDIPSG